MWSAPVRSRRDSNPRYRFQYADLANLCLQPLGHDSTGLLGFGAEKLNPSAAGCKPALHWTCPGRTLASVSDVTPSPERGRLKVAFVEVGLALGGLLAGTLVFFLLSAIGLLPTKGVLGLGVRMAAGPAITLLAVAAYRGLLRMLQDIDSPLLGAEVDHPAPFPRGSVGLGLAWAGIGIAAAIAGSYVLGLSFEWLGVPVEEQESIVELVESFKAGAELLPFVLLALSAVVLAPFAEEWLFRGLVFRRIAASGGRLPEAFALSAASFAAIHTNPAGFVVYLWLGLVFAEAYRRSGRLWVAMLVHAGNNAFALTLLVWG